MPWIAEGCAAAAGGANVELPRIQSQKKEPTKRLSEFEGVIRKRGIIRFAHLADCHLGAFRDEVLKEMNIRAFESAMDRCVKEEVDFIIIAGDLFHTNVPDMKVAERCARKLREVKEKGIEVYVLYGSHDYSPTEKSIIDVLNGAGIFHKIGLGEHKEKLVLKTENFRNIRIFGLMARTTGLEKGDFEVLDRDYLESQPDPKIFVFHSAISEYRPSFLKEEECVPLSYFPRGFVYYAGGHLHARKMVKEEYGLFVYPGHLFGSDFRDLEYNSRNKPGFYMVDLKDGEEPAPHFIEIDVPDVVVLDFPAEGKSISQLKEEIEKKTSDDFTGKIVLIKVYGRLAGGKPNELELEKIQQRITARVCVLNRNQLSSAETLRISVHPDKSKEDLEKDIIGEFISKGKFQKNLSGKDGLNLALSLINVLRQEQHPNESKDTYYKRIFEDARKIMVGG